LKNRHLLFIPVLSVALVFFVSSCLRDTSAHVISDADGAYFFLLPNGEGKPGCYIVSSSEYAVFENTIITFPPLQDNERFAFYMQTLNENRLFWQKITMYALRNNDAEDITELFTWEPVAGNRHGGIQFTEDLKKFFFQESTPTFGHRIFHLYFANGITGEIRRLFTDMGHTPWRVSKDGRFILFQRSAFNTGYVTLFLFCVENKAIAGELKWRPYLTLYMQHSFINGWDIRRFDSIFRIYALGEAASIVAEAELNPLTMELRTLWDERSEIEFLAAPYAHEGSWVDDVLWQQWNPDPSIRLYR